VSNWIIPAVVASLIVATNVAASAGQDKTEQPDSKIAPAPQAVTVSLTLLQVVVPLPVHEKPGRCRGAGDLMGPLSQREEPGGEADVRRIIADKGQNVVFVTDPSKIGVNEHRLSIADGKVTISKDETSSIQSPCPWRILTAPRVAVNVGQEAQVNVGREIAYIEKRDDDCLRVKIVEDAMEGVSLRLTPEKVAGTSVTFNDIRIKLTKVVDRQTFEGVPLDVGRPTLSSRETSVAITIPTERVAVIRLPQSGQDDTPLLLFLSVELPRAE